MLLLDGDAQVVSRAVARHARVARGVAEHHDQLAFLNGLERTRAPAAAVREGNGAEVERAVGVVAVAGDLAAAKVEQAEERVVHHHVLLDARAFLDEDRLVAVRFGDALEFRRDGVQRLVPADLLVLALAALRALDALHGVVQAVFAVDPAADGSPAQAGARLEAAERGIAGVVGFHVDDLVILHMALEHAGAAAVHMAVRPHHLFLGRTARIRRVAAFLRLAFGRAPEQGAASQRRGTQSSERRAFHEGAARDGAFHRFRHVPSLCLFLSSSRPANRIALRLPWPRGRSRPRPRPMRRRDACCDVALARWKRGAL